MTLADLLYESLWPLNEPDPDEALKKFCEALCSPMEELHAVLEEGEDGSVPYSKVFDVDECPAAALPYLAQYVGVQIQPEWTEEQIRQEIREPTSWRRGQEPSMETAGQRHLTGTKYIVVKPNTPEVGFIYARTLKTETPDEGVTEADIESQKPAWMVLDYEAFDGFTLADFAAKYATIGDAEAAYTTLADATSDTP